MGALLSTFLVLYLVFAGFGIMLGLVSPGRALRLLLLLLLLPVVLLVGGQALVVAWAGLPVAARLVLLFVGLPLLASTLLFRSGFGREVFASILGNAAYDWLRNRGCTLGCLPLLLLAILLFALLS